MSKTRTPPTPEQLEQMLGKHLSFEINCFRAAASLWDSPRFGTLIDAMVRESALIHMRLLLDFFYPRINPEKTKFSDVFVTDYLPDRARLSPECQRLLAEPSWLQDYRDQLDQRLAHLTFKRIDFDTQPVWQPSEQFAHLENLISAFLVALPTSTAALFNPHQQ